MVVVDIMANACDTLIFFNKDAVKRLIFQLIQTIIPRGLWLTVSRSTYFIFISWGVRKLFSSNIILLAWHALDIALGIDTIIDFFSILSCYVYTRRQKQCKIPWRVVFNCFAQFHNMKKHLLCSSNTLYAIWLSFSFSFLFLTSYGWLKFRWLSGGCLW